MGRVEVVHLLYVIPIDRVETHQLLLEPLVLDHFAPQLIAECRVVGRKLHTIAHAQISYRISEAVFGSEHRHYQEGYLRNKRMNESHT